MFSPQNERSYFSKPQQPMKIYLLCYATTVALGITAFHQPASPLLKTPPRESSCSSSSLRLLRPPPLTTTSCSSSALNSSPDATSSSSSRSLTNTADDAHYQLDQKTWMFQNKYPIAYEVAKVVSDNDTDNNSDEVPILLLNGFGVGSFHQHRLMRQLLIEQQQQQQQQQQQEHPTNNRQYIIYGIDYLGQGKSWPTNPQDGNSPDEYLLGYSADMWLDQLSSFVQEVILSSLESSTTAELESTALESNVVNNNNNKVHLVGNSVGGYLATILTHRHQHLVASLTLLNATPVWGLNLPGWDGRLPAPMIPKIIGRQLFDVIRNEDVIKEYLNAAYVNSKAFDGSFVDSFDGWGGCGGGSCKDDGVDANNDGGGGEPSLGIKIRQCTENNGGHAAFASILWSAPASGVSFYDALEQLQEVDVLLLFGADDPWCTQAVGKRMHVTLDKRKSDGARTTVSTTAAHRFVTLDNVGHCPNHEAPTAVARVLLPWLNANDSDQRRVVPLGSQTLIKEPWGEVFIREVSIAESNSLGLVDRVVSTMVG